MWKLIDQSIDFVETVIFELQFYIEGISHGNQFANKTLITHYTCYAKLKKCHAFPFQKGKTARVSA